MRSLLFVAMLGCKAPADTDTDEPFYPEDTGTPQDTDPSAFAWDLPAGFPIPLVPETNPMSDAKVELGRHLFYDERLSENRTMSCATCHEQARAFTDGRAQGLGSTGEIHPRGPMGLTNVAYLSRFGWGNPLLTELEQQGVVPIFGFEPVELGMRGKEDELVARLLADEAYPERFAASWPDEPDPVTVAHLVEAISAFERTLISGDAPFDRWVRGEEDAISERAKNGYELFNSERLECFHCHSGFNFQDSVKYEGKALVEARFHNTGLYNIGGTGDYPPDNTGIHEITGRANDMGRFRAPTLRNIAVTAPYMHDGSVPDLDGVLDHYAAGGRTIASGPYAGVGSESPYQSSLIRGFTLSESERRDVLEFLRSLTDEGFLTDPKFSDPTP